ncbi:hypothetical protein [Bacillus thuringiensis]|uniref:hypothetical protein n=1 Tax=Bacillus thuringiensis TaxID=1428 RepID=UPI000BF25A44|nr:hypothetical protein [Bacillus thuringiensis]PFD60104.1 hypothetical protein CN274_08265 [Bacillus thuringiensis]
MAVTMKEAYSTILNEKVSAQEIDEPVNKHLKQELECGVCRIPVAHRTRHMRNEVDIPALFYRKGGINHEEFCSYNTLGQIKVIARDSDDDILKSVEDKTFLFRLNMIHEPLEELKNQNTKPKNDQNKALNKKDRTYHSSGSLNSYLSTMKKIIELRNILEKQTELHSIIEIEMHGKRIKWSDFYYEPNRYIQAFNYIKQLEWKNRHPICIEGIVDSVRYIEISDKYAINLRWEKKGINSKGIEQIPSPSIFFDAGTLSPDDIKAGQHIAVCSLCSPRMNGGKVREFLNTNAHLYHKNQLVILSD